MSPEMLTLRRGRVTAVVSRVEGLARIEVDGVPCVAYPRLTGPVALGDEVIVNVQARELELGSGGFDVVVCGVGPGIVGTGSSFGHGGLAAAGAANTASALDGDPVLAVRASQADARERHRGASHHVRDVLRLCGDRVVAAWPRGSTT